MFAAMSGSEIVGLVLGISIYIIIEAYLFWGACALADFELPSWSITLMIITPLVLLKVGLIYYLTLKVYPDDKPIWENLDASRLLAEYFSAVFWIRYGILSAVIWLLLAVGFLVMKPGKVLRSMYAAGAFLFLEVLIGTLVLGLVMVVLAFMQIGTKAPEAKPAPSSALVAPVLHRT